jgi:hypothetical protein
MLSRKSLVIASLCTIVCAQAGIADDKFKSAEFLTWSDQGRKSYIATSVMMAGVIAGQNKPIQAKCIGQWMSDNEAAGFPSVKDAMERFPEHHPTGVIVAVLEKACGSIRYISQ